MRTALLTIALALCGCATPQPASDGLARARLGETVYVDGPEVTPLELLEDSRCPADVDCVWAGRVRISARVDLGGTSETRELTLGESVNVADGSLELCEVLPPSRAEATIPPENYRFSFRFVGGI